MLLIHVRTVAFLASLLTAFQCVLWIIGYILYILAYSCSYNTEYFSSDHEKYDLPIDLGNYYVWYLQGVNCTTSLDWIKNVRSQSPDLLVILLSIGLSWNTALLSTSIYMIVGLYLDIGKPGLRLKIFSYSVLLVSAWDLILVAVFVVDFSPLLDKKNYLEGIFYPNSTNPNIIALPYFTEVFTVIILLLSRLILFWILNVLFAAYLLAKNTNEVSPNSTSPLPNTNSIKNNLKRNSLWADTLDPPVETNTNPGKDYFANSRFKQQIPSPPIEYPHDEVSKRWIISPGKEQDFFYPDFCEDDEEYQDIESRSGSDSRSHETTEEPRNNIRWDGDRWKKEEETVLPNVKRAESNKRVTLENKPSFIQSMRQSFSKKQLHSKPPDNLRESFKKQGFSYIPSVNPNTEKSNPFNVKLKHVPRASIPNEETERNTTENSGNSGGEANPYLISPLSGLDLDYIPRDHINFPITPPMSPLDYGEDKSKSKLEPPPLPPPDAPHPPPNLGFTPQMSLEEAIKTRRPLKPVNRSPIDTTC